MLWSYVTGLVAVVGVTLAWVAVQSAWRQAFPEAGPDPDALAGRTGCGGCTGGDCGGGHCTVENHAVEHRAMENTQIEHDGRIGTAVEEIP